VLQGCYHRLCLDVVDTVLYQPMKHFDHGQDSHKDDQSGIKVLPKHCECQTYLHNAMMKSLSDPLHLALPQPSQVYLHIQAEFRRLGVMLFSLSSMESKEVEHV
jgi:hypothetical protein